MARIRSLKPDFFLDAKLARLIPNRDARMLYAGLWTIADEHGRLRGDPNYIKGQVFPYDDDLTGERIQQHLDDLETAQRIVAYDVDDEMYLFLPNLARHNRMEPHKSKSKYPPPPGPNNSAPDPDRPGRRADDPAHDTDHSEPRADLSAHRADMSAPESERPALTVVEASGGVDDVPSSPIGRHVPTGGDDGNSQVSGDAQIGADLSENFAEKSAKARAGIRYRGSKAAVRAPAGERAPARETPPRPDLTDLRAALMRAGLPRVQWGKLDRWYAEEVAALVDRHGIDVLVTSALAGSRRDDPARFAMAWLPGWRELDAAGGLEPDRRVVASLRAREGAERRAQAIRECGLCDDDGRINRTTVCDHDPARYAAERRASIEARAHVDQLFAARKAVS